MFTVSVYRRVPSCCFHFCHILLIGSPCLFSSLDASSSSPADAIVAAEVLDSAYLSALIQCAPPRRQAVVDLLARANRCHVDTAAVLVASQGVAFIEALLWLYRTKNEHRRVLSALTEDRCVGSGSRLATIPLYGLQLTSISALLA